MKTAGANLEAPSFEPPHNLDHHTPELTPIPRPLGNPELPIYNFRAPIVDTVNKHQVTIITAETGAGKSTQVPQFLLEAGYSIVATQPRIVAARSLAQRIRSELSDVLGDDATPLVGYRTANEGDSQPENKISFFTDGLQVNHELSGDAPSASTVYIYDEIHEWNANMELLVALAKRRIQTDPDFRLVLMSATIDTTSLAHYFSDAQGNPAPVIMVPGRTYEVEELTGGMVVDEVKKYASAGKNVIDFLPGKGDIAATNGMLAKSLGNRATILALHGDQTSSEQALVFNDYDNTKIVSSTRAGQTSITIDGMDVVVDGGWERTGDVANGVEGLYLRPASIASADQRRGRVGRTKPGIYVHAQIGGFPPAPPRNELEAFDKPEILRKRPDGMLLKLAQFGIAMEELPFFHQPNPEGMVGARLRLARLGALALSGELTVTGRAMEFLPLEPHFARMIVAARQCSEDVALQLAAAIAVQQSKGIAQYDSSSQMRWRKLSKEPSSDILRELDVYIAARSMTEEQLDRHDITQKRFLKARDFFLDICQAENLRPDRLGSPNLQERQELINCMIIGTDEIFRAKGKGFVDRRGTYRRVMPETVVPKDTQFIMGSAFTLQKMTHNGPANRHYVRGASGIASAGMLEAAAPQRCTYQPKGYVIWQNGTTHSRRELLFDGAKTDQISSIPAVGSLELNDFMLRSLLDGTVPETVATSPNAQRLQQTVAQLRQFEVRSLETLKSATRIEQLISHIAGQIPTTCVTIAEIDEYIPNISIEDLLSTKQMSQIRATAPDSITIAGFKMPITYSEGTAIITTPRHLWKMLPTTLATQLGERRVLVDHPAESTQLELSAALDAAENQPRRKRRLHSSATTKPNVGPQTAQTPSNVLRFSPRARAFTRHQSSTRHRNYRLV
jgi:HrpA-like RNA helicase